MGKYYTYIYLDPRKPSKVEYPDLDMCFLFEPFYAGKGQKRTRLYDHISEAKNHVGCNEKKEAKIREILEIFSKEEFKRFIIKYTENLTSETAIKHENKLIYKIGRTIEKEPGPLDNIRGRGWDIGPEAHAKAQATKKRRGTGKIAGQKAAITKKKNGTCRGGGLRGKKNGRATKILFISPDGEEFIVHGTQQKFIKEHNLTGQLLQWKNKGPYPSNPHYYTQKAKNTAGWEVRTLS
jgi:hypothetical protein